MPKPRRTFRIDIRDQRLPGGRFCCSARTTNAPEFRRRDAAVRALIEAGALDVLQRITAAGPTRLHIADVVTAVQRGDIEALRLAKGSPLLLGATIDRLIQRKEATRSKGTQSQVRVTMGQIEAAFGVQRDTKRRILIDVDMGSISARECEAFLHRPRSDGRVWAANTQTVRHSYAQEVWQLAIDEEGESAEREGRKPRLRRNPWTAVDPAPAHQTRVIFLTATERDAMLRVLDRTPLCAFLAVAYHAGLRVTEAAMLRTDIDVDMDAGLLHIQGRVGEYAWMTKTRKDREVPINRDLRRVLQSHIDLGYAGRRFFFRTPTTDRPLSRAAAWRWWTEAYTAAGIKHGRADADAVVYHTGRHTFCSLLVQQGVSPLIVAELAGNDYKQVVDVYGHLAPHNLADAVKTLESSAVSNESSNAKTKNPHVS